jgi:hypothetical protein
MGEQEQNLVEQFVYEFDRETYQNNGKSLLYRNRIDGNQNFEFSRFNGGDIKYMPVIAEGFTAFLSQRFDCRLGTLKLEVIPKYGKLEAFDLYLKQQIQPIIKKLTDLPGKIDEHKALQKALHDHLEMEKDFFKKSSKFYDRSIGNQEKNLKEEIKKYVEDYFDWVSEQIEKRKESSLKKKDTISEEFIERIAADLVTDKIIFMEDKEFFKGIFLGQPFVRKVRWNGDVKYAKKGIFALIYHLTGKKVMASEVKEYFDPYSKDNSYKINGGQYGQAYKEGDAYLFVPFTDRWFPR